MELAEFKVALDAWLDEHEVALTPEHSGRARSTSRWRTWRR